MRTIRQLGHDNDGAALTEYLIMMGLCVAAGAGGVELFGGNISAAFESWAAWNTTNTPG